MKLDGRLQPFLRISSLVKKQIGYLNRKESDQLRSFMFGQQLLLGVSCLIWEMD